MARKKPRKIARSHAGRNLSILALLVAIAIIAMALSGALPAPQTPSGFKLFIHVYDPSKGTPETLADLNCDNFVCGVLISVSGPQSFTEPTPSGILSPSGLLPEGTYQITTTKTGYKTTTIPYVVGPDCDRRDPQGFCLAWVAMPETLSS